MGHLSHALRETTSSFTSLNAIQSSFQSFLIPFCGSLSVASTIVVSTLMSFITIPIVVFIALKYFS